MTNAQSHGEALLSHRSRLYPGLVIILSFAMYWPSLWASFHPVDDWQYVTANPYVSRPSVASVKAVFTEVLNPTTVRGYYQPLAMLSLIMDRAIQLSFSPEDASTSPLLFHFTNILLHALNSLLVYFLILQLTSRHLGALLAALLFAIHPINVECVTWISQRKAVLSTLFVLVAILCHVRFARTQHWRWQLLTTISYASATLTKPTSILLPFALLMLDIWPLRRFNRYANLAQFPNFIVAVICGCIAHYSQLSYFEDEHWDRYWSFAQTILLACHGLTFYMSRTLLPIGLCPEYLLANDQEVSWTSPTFIFGAAGVIAVLILFVWAVRRRDVAVWTMLGAYVLMLAPTLTPVKYQESIAADRFAYTPMVFMLILLVELANRQRFASIVPRGVAAICIIGFASWLVLENLRQQQIRRGAREYYRAIAQSYPDHPRGQYCHGRALLIEQDMLAGNSPDQARNYEMLTAARLAFEGVIQKEPEYSTAYYGLAEVLIKQGRSDEGIIKIRQGMSQPGAGNDGLWILGAALSNAGRFSEAIEPYRQYLKANPLHAPARKNLANALLHTGRSAESIAEYEKLFELDVNDLDAMQNWAVALLTANRSDDAIALLRRIVEKRSRQALANVEKDSESKLADARYTLAGALAMRGNSAEAAELLKLAFQTKPTLKDDYLRNPAFESLRMQNRGNQHQP